LYFIKKIFKDPTITNPDKLKKISGRAMWKIRHKKPLKRRNRRLERKGVHNR